ncbi:peroxiredoxin [Chloroflexia bacterium SDU3-3]|nr:peroxiredoxin [Chloroflexia bacterium SDU3-3]
MAKHRATILWERNGATFSDNRYSRGHRWLFDGGSEVAASSSPAVVPLPLSVAAAVDPEEAFVASLSSCHMLWFLSIASKHGYTVESYRDEAEGMMGYDEGGRQLMAQVTLRPMARFASHDQPSAADVEEMHRDAHEQCFIARSVKTDVRCEPIYAEHATDIAIRRAHL